MGEPCTPDALLEAVRGLRVADPDLGFKPLLAKLRAQQPDLGAATKEVREALAALKAESEAAEAAAAQPAAEEGVPPAAEEGVPPAADEGGAPLPVALSLACAGCGRLPSEMDDEREKHPVCVPQVRQAKAADEVLVLRQLPRVPWRLAAAHGVSHQGGEEAASERGGRMVGRRSSGIAMPRRRWPASLPSRATSGRS